MARNIAYFQIFCYVKAVVGVAIYDIASENLVKQANYEAFITKVKIR